MGSGLWSVEFVKLEGESWTDGIGRSGAVQKHETFRGHVEFWGPGRMGREAVSLGLLEFALQSHLPA